MKKILLFLMLLTFSMPTVLKAVEVTIGDPSATTTQYTLPVNMFFHYSLTQQIYTAEEIGMAGTINSISFEYTNSSSFTMNDVQVYMLNVDKASFTSTTDMEAVTSNDLVWSGTLSATGAGWVTITLDSPFEYDGTSNLLICFYDPTSGYPGSAYKWRTTATTEYLGLAYYSDSYTPSLTDLTTYSGSKIRYQYRANIQLDITPSSGDFCYPVSHFSVTDITENGATVFWTAPENANGYILEYKASTMDWDDDDVVTVNLMDTFYILTGLNANTYYNVRVLHTCSFGNSAYKSLSFKTECGIISVADEPYLEGFEGYASYAFPDCWTRIAGYSTSSYDYPYVNNSATPNSGSGSLYFYNNVANPIYVALPTFVDNINTLRVSFWMKPVGTTAAYGRFEVGLMSDLTDTATFRMVKGWSALQIGSTTWQYYVVDFDTVNTTSDDFIVFRRVIDGTSTTAYGWYFDDLKVMPIPACDEPLYLDVVSVTNNSANLTWDGGDNTNFTVYYRSSPDEDYSSQNNVTLDEDNIYTLTDLEANTTYDWYVATVCSDGVEYNSLHSTFTTKCNPLEAPFTEAFNANTRPDCWEVFSGLASSVFAGTTTLTTSSDWIFTNTNVFGAYHAKINIYGTTKKGWLMTPAIDLSSLNTPTLTFDLALTKFNNENPITPGNQADDKFMVLISTDLGATWSAEDAIVWSNDGNGDYVYDQISTEGEFIAIPLTDYAGETIRIAFYGESTASGGDNDLHIDNVSVDEAPACLPPTLLTITELTNNSASLEWEAGDQSSWLVEYDTVGFTLGTGTPIVVTGDPSVTITDLASSTEYDVYVMADCGGSYSLASKKTFTTLCDGIATLPQTWTFEDNLTAGTTSYLLPACWNRISTSTTTAQYPYAYNSSSYAHNGTRCLYYYNSYANSLGILPGIDADVFDIQDLQLSFYASCSSTSSFVRLDVGVMTDPNEDSTFTLVQTIPLTSSYTTDPYVVTFTNYSGTGTYIAFRNTPTSTSSATNYFYIDDVTLEESPSCSKALYLSAAPGAFSADLTWMAEGEDFDVYYKAASDTEYTEVSDVVLEDGVFTLTGLTSSTTYTWYVVTNCDDTVYTSSTATFTTSCAPVTAPFMENFDAGTTLPNCWGRYNGLASDVFAGGALTSTTSGWLFTNTYVFGEHHPKVNIYGSSCKYWLVTPEIDLSQLTAPALTFNLALTDYGNANPIENDTTAQLDDKFMVIVSTDNGNTWSASNATIWSNDSTADYVYNQISYTGEEVTISLEDYADQTIRIAFYGESTAAGGDNDLHIDNVYVGEAPSCAAPSQLIVSQITQTSAELNWTENGDATSWVVEYDTAGFVPGTGEVITVNGTPNVTLNNLLDAHTYDVYVSAVCDGGGNSNPASATFRTACLALDQIPQTWNFDGVGTGTSVHPDCWICTNTYSSTQYPYVYGSNPYSGNADLYFYSSTSTYSLAVLPMVDVNIYPLNTLQVSFMMRSYTPASVRMVVGTMTDPSDITTFEAIDTVYNNASGVYELKEVALSNYEGSAPYVALKMINLSSTTYAYVDDVTLDYIPTCPRPQHLTVTNVTTSSVELEWTDISSASSWEIAYGEPGFDPNDVDEATYVTANTNPFTVQNLNSSSTFDFYVRALCSSSDMSPWSEKVSVSTTMVPVDLPYTATFDANDAWVLNNGSCINYWTKGTVGNESALFVTNDGTTPSYTITSVSVVSAQKLFTVGTSDTITITFDVEVKGESSWDYMKLFLAPATEQFPASTSAPSTGTYGYNSYSTNAYDFYTNGYGSQSSYHYIMNMATGTVHVVAKMPNPNTTPTATSTAQLVFAWKNDSSGGTQPPATITNLTVTANGSGPGPVITDPTVATNAATSIAQTTATLNATITNPDNVTITAKGFEWKTTTGGTYTTVAGTGTGSTFTANLTNLTANTGYTFKAFITYNGTTVYGDELTFTTLEQGQPTDPTVATTAATAVAQTAATLNATITNPDNVTITAKGFEWKATAGGTYTQIAGTGTGNTFTANLSGLTENTQYTYKAFITYNGATVYGDEMTFTTLSQGQLVDPTVATDAATAIEQTTATLNATITNPDNVTITAKGFEWKATTGGTYTQIAGTGTGNTFTANLTGLTANTSYTYKAFITFNGTTVYGSEMTFTTLPDDTPEPCDAPTGLTAGDITGESIAISWDNNPNASSWNVQYRPMNGQLSSATSSTNSYVITGLTSNTTYQIQVQANCGDNNLSEWSEILTVTTTGLNNYLLNSIALYPNPANDVINVQCTMNDVQLKDIEVIDVYGKVVSTVVETLPATSLQTQINVSGLAAGIYFVRVTTEQGVATKTFVKK